MRRTLLLGLAPGLVLLLGGPVAAQQTPPDATPVPATWAFKANFTPLLAKGYHLTAEKALGSSRHSLNLTPQWYRGRLTEYTSKLSPAPDGDRVRGYGLEVLHRIYLNPRSGPLEGSYLAYGPHYQYFDVGFQARSWQQYTAPNGLLYYEYRLGPQTESIRRFGAVVVFGRQLRLQRLPLVLDLGVGLGWRAVHSRTTAPPTGRYNSSLNDYGHEGVFLPVSVRLGWIPRG
ncbi:hypothetical protein [Hymenobacter weizhouensis]|uniref:hypothetical protein n=1 Tax=Hymenobacter sp. YIM 151500-1 TaxID=2987689 RepID=UPI002227FE47|nr:hypothetical protein [Hymenobacter sp. YIM 151500-1]UYZ61595.1 hypothetical protein OIS53_11310 [Hymenobacter sp. YIM 151500-1]